MISVIRQEKLGERSVLLQYRCLFVFITKFFYASNFSQGLKIDYLVIIVMHYYLSLDFSSILYHFNGIEKI